MAFLAIRVPEQTIQSLPLLALKEEFPQLDWTLPLDLHLTLRFFGNQDTDMTRLMSSLSKNKTETTSFELTLKGAGVFDRGPLGGVIWLSLAETPEPLLALQSELEVRARRLKYRADYRPFAPHITVARYTEAQRTQAEELVHAVDANPNFSSTFLVQKFVLMKRLKKDPQRLYHDAFVSDLSTFPQKEKERPAEDAPS